MRVSSILRRLAVLSMLLLGTLHSAGISAHTLGQSYVYMTLSESRVVARFELTAADLNRALGLDLPTDGTLTVEQAREHEARIAGYLTDRVAMTIDEQPATLEYRRITLRNLKLAQFVMPEFDVKWRSQGNGFPRRIDVTYDVLFEVDEKHTAFLLLERNWRDGTYENEAAISLTFTDDDRNRTLDLSESTLWRGFVHMVAFGATHIIEGIDHVLFLVALLLTSVVVRRSGHWEPVETLRGSAWNVLKIVTLFTIAHSITLSLVTLDSLHVSSRLVESAIAASIVLVALDVFYPLFRGRIGIFVFLFGLFHGAGFATVLRELSISSDYLVLTLLAFNVGVELGQVGIVCIIFPFLFLIRRRPLYLRWGLRAAAAALIVVAGYWFIERALGIDLPAGAIANKLLSLVD